MKSIAIIGASGAIGNALLDAAKRKYPAATLYAFSRNHPDELPKQAQWHTIDITKENSVLEAASSLSAGLDLVVVASGMLHENNIKPEKSLKDISALQMEQLFAVNTIGPALVAKHFLPKLHTKKHNVFAALSARVGSISDNHLGGWYSYRASKAALNMLLRCASIEMAHRNKETVILGLHPGTVDSRLSKPFQRTVPEGQLFTPTASAERLLKVIETANPSDTGRLFDYDGNQIPF